jgi:hypothetical protein
VANAAFESDTAVIREANPYLRWLSPVLVATPVALGLFAKPFFAMLPMFVALAFFSAFVLRKYNPYPRTRPGRLGADEAGVKRDGVLVLPRHEIKQGFVLAGDGRWLVRFEHSGWKKPTEIAVDSIEEGRALLRALGLDASQTAATVRGMSRLFALPRYAMIPIFMLPALGAMLIAGFARASGHPGAAAVLMPLIMLSMAVTLIVPTRIRVGADGISTRWLGRERFHAFKDIERVAPYESGFGTRKYVGLELTLRSGKSIRLPVGQKMWSDRESSLLFERVREAIDVYRSAAAGVDASALARRGREPGDWIRSLRAIGAGAGADMRTAAVPVEQLLSVVLDSTARAIDRASAAVAVAPVLPAEDRQRIRVAAEMAASPKLRVALERASAEPGEAPAVRTDDAAVAEALADLEEEEKEREKEAAKAKKS